MPSIDVNQFLDASTRDENARRESGLPPSPRPQSSGAPSVTSRNGQPLITGDFNQTMQNFVDAARDTANTRRDNHVQDMNMQNLLQLAQVLSGGRSGGSVGGFSSGGGSSGSRSAGTGNPALDLFHKNLQTVYDSHNKTGIGDIDPDRAHKDALAMTQRQLKDFSAADPNSIESTTSRGGFAGAQHQPDWRDDAQKAIVSAMLGRMGGDLQSSFAPLLQGLQSPSGQNSKSLINLQSALPSSGMTVTPPAISPSFAQAGVTPPAAPAAAPLPKTPSLGQNVLSGAAGTAFRSGAFGPLSGLFPDAQGALGSATVSAIGGGIKTAGDMLGTGIAKGAMAVKNFFTNDQPATADPLRGIN